MVEFQLAWSDWFLCCTGPGVKHDSGERHSKRLDHVQSEYRWSGPSGPSEWKKINSSTSACRSLPSNLLRGKFHYSWRHPRSPPGHLHPAAQMEEGMWHVQHIQLQLEMKPSYHFKTKSVRYDHIYEYSYMNKHRNMVTFVTDFRGWFVWPLYGSPQEISGNKKKFLHFFYLLKGKSRYNKYIL